VRVGIVTPSFNQAGFLARTLDSVLAQRGDFELDYLVVDGASTDGSVDILRRRGPALRWLSEADRGQSEAVNKGLRLVRGDVLAWVNSDDAYEPGAVSAAVEAIRAGARWCFGQCRIVDEDDREIRRGISRYKNRLASGYSLGRLYAGNFIAQPAVFFRRDLLEEVGPLDESLHLAMDYDLWLRFAEVAEPRFLPRDLARFRWHGRSKTSGRYAASAWEAFTVARRRAAGRHPLALARHLVQVAAMIAGYAVLERLPSLERPGAPGRSRT
jgi:glycosyltransferase involved in cell wall biosynthesis